MLTKIAHMHCSLNLRLISFNRSTDAFRSMLRDKNRVREALNDGVSDNSYENIRHTLFSKLADNFNRATKARPDGSI